MTNPVKNSLPLDRVEDLFNTFFGEKPTAVTTLPPSGSDRHYFRLSHSGGSTYLAAYNPNVAENNTYLYFTHVFNKLKLPIPKVLTVDKRKEIYLLEDLGPDTLFDLLEKVGLSDHIKSLYKKAIDQLVRFHLHAGGSIDYSMCFAAQKFDREQIYSDLLYFKYYFVDLLGIKYDKTSFLNELHNWSEELSGRGNKTFMYRDFQSRNIMVKEDEVYFIDFQGGMLGLPEYDLASLLWQARARLPKEFKAEMLAYYIQCVEKEKNDFKEIEFRKIYLQCVLLRVLQTFGAYGYRGMIQHKNHFLKSIAPALEQLKAFLEDYPSFMPYRELLSVLQQIVAPEVKARFKELTYSEENADKLKVKVYSFSFKKGLLKEVGEHGGGFVFDCRGILNPGRQEAYKTLTGKDPEVIHFLEQKTTMPKFMRSVYDIVSISVMDYLNRGFDSLTVAFGCTGGQHRSVYAAEHLAAFLKREYGVTVELLHLEQEEQVYERR